MLTAKFSSVLKALGFIPALLLLAALISGCASTYKGPRPDFGQTGPAARAEAEKFTLDESNHVAWRGSWFEMGLNKDWYTIRSLRPMIEEISPEAATTLVRARRWSIARYSSYVGAAVLIGLGAANDHVPTRDKLIAGGVLVAGTGVAMGYTYDSLLSSAASQFNRDMRRRFTPSLAWAWTY